MQPNRPVARRLLVSGGILGSVALAAGAAQAGPSEGDARSGEVRRRPARLGARAGTTAALAAWLAALAAADAATGSRASWFSAGRAAGRKRGAHKFPRAAHTRPAPRPLLAAQVSHTDAEWRKLLSSDSYHVLREVGGQ
jgi:hypothetical protein